MPTNNCSRNIIGYFAAPIEEIIATVDLGAELRKIGLRLGMVVNVFNLRLWAAWLETRSDFQKRSNAPAGLDTDFDYELTTS